MAAQVLTITNNVKLGKMLHRLLSSASIEFVLKETLPLAASYLKTEILPFLVILDWSLQSEDRIHFLRQMRASKRFAELPVLVIVAEPDPDLIKEALQAGANRYLTQSFIPANLLPTLREMLVNAPRA